MLFEDLAKRIVGPDVLNPVEERKYFVYRYAGGANRDAVPAGTAEICTQVCGLLGELVLLFKRELLQKRKSLQVSIQFRFAAQSGYEEFALLISAVVAMI